MKTSANDPATETDETRLSIKIIKIVFMIFIF